MFALLGGITTQQLTSGDVNEAGSASGSNSTPGASQPGDELHHLPHDQVPGLPKSATHESEVPGSKLIDVVSQGWPPILASLVETWESLEAMRKGCEGRERGRAERLPVSMRRRRGGRRYWDVAEEIGYLWDEEVVVAQEHAVPYNLEE